MENSGGVEEDVGGEVWGKESEEEGGEVELRTWSLKGEGAASGGYLFVSERAPENSRERQLGSFLVVMRTVFLFGL